MLNPRSKRLALGIIVWGLVLTCVVVAQPMFNERMSGLIFRSEVPVDEFESEYVEQLEEVSPQAQIRADEECALHEDQLDHIRFSFSVGEPHDLGYTLAAIAIKESGAGKWRVNVQDPSAGLYHVTLDKVIRDLNWEDTNFNLNRAAALLIEDRDYASKLAINELNQWRDQRSGDWMQVWASYRAGQAGMKSNSGEDYANDIRRFIQQIQYCRWVY